jgi:hypothetical protein
MVKMSRSFTARLMVIAVLMSVLVGAIPSTYAAPLSTSATLTRVYAQSCLPPAPPAPCGQYATWGKDVGRDFFTQVVALLKDDKVTDFAVDALMAWKPFEGTKAYWNPLATTWKMSPVCNFNKVGVQSYVSRDLGVRATANTLNQGYYNDSTAKRLASYRRACGPCPTCSADSSSWRPPVFT